MMTVGLLVAVPACGDDCDEPGSVSECESCGFIFRPSPAGPVFCESGEVQVSEVPSGIEGGVCCDPG